MTLLFVMNLNFSWGVIAGPTFNPVWAVNANSYVGPIAPQPVMK